MSGWNTTAQTVTGVADPGRARSRFAASPPSDVVERVLDERPVLGLRGDGSTVPRPAVDRTVPALAPLAGLPEFRWRLGRPGPARLPAPPGRLLPRPVLDHDGRNGPKLGDNL